MTDIDMIKATPGSDSAVENGCTCPVRDNGHGRGYMGVADQYWIDSLCPIHSDIEDDEPRSEPGNQEVSA